MVARKFTVLLQPAEEGGFIVKCLELPVASQGETRDEALKNIKEAIEGYLEAKTKIPRSKVKGEWAEVIVEAPLLEIRDNEIVISKPEIEGSYTEYFTSTQAPKLSKPVNIKQTIERESDQRHHY